MALSKVDIAGPPGKGKKNLKKMLLEVKKKTHPNSHNKATPGLSYLR